MEVEVAVQVAGEADQRATIVVAIAIEGAVEQVLNEVLDRRRQHDGDENRQQRQHPLVRSVALQKHRPHGFEQRPRRSPRPPRTP